MAAEDAEEPVGLLAMLGGEDDGEEMAEEGAEERAVREFFEAGKSGDYAGATAAFKRAYSLCGGSKSESPAEEMAEDTDEY